MAIIRGSDSDASAESDERERRSALRRLLMECRARLSPADVGIASVGHRRVPGLRREEVAELVGITPAWYTQLETGSDIRVSARLLDRLATCLRLDDDEKARLFSLALEEFRVLSPSLRLQTHAVLEAFSSMRRFSRRLWQATTIREALAIAREQCVISLAPDAMFSTVNTGLGRWDVQWSGDNAVTRRTLEISSHIVSTWPPSLRDEAHLLGILRRPGDVLTRQETPMSSDLMSRFAEILKVLEWPTLDDTMAAVHSKNGLISRLTAIYDKPHVQTDTERAIISTLADLTSLALADAPASAEA